MLKIGWQKGGANTPNINTLTQSKNIDWGDKCWDLLKKRKSICFLRIFLLTLQTCSCRAKSKEKYILI